MESTLLSPKTEHSANITGQQIQHLSLTDLLIVITSSPEHFDRRNLIRESWGASPLVYSGRVKVVFMLGQKSNMSEYEREALKESQQDKHKVCDIF